MDWDTFADRLNAVLKDYEAAVKSCEGEGIMQIELDYHTMRFQMGLTAKEAPIRMSVSYGAIANGVYAAAIGDHAYAHSDLMLAYVPPSPMAMGHKRRGE